MRHALSLSLLALLVAPIAHAQTVAIDFEVDMRYRITEGQFDPATQFVDLAGSFNGWDGAGDRLADADGDSVYAITKGGFSVGSTIEFKFRIDGSWSGTEEFPNAGPNREYVVQPSGNTIRVWYSDEAPPTGPPVAAFRASPARTTEGGVVYFGDRSSGNVTGWKWTFEGGAPSISTEQSPVVRYSDVGTYDATLIAFGPEGIDTLTVTDAVTVAERPPFEAKWWHDAVFYEVFVRSFQDSDGDGIGDLQGLISRLDYLNDGDPSTTDDLGVTALWLMPINPSPSYHGYDVTDYRGVESDYGTMDDMRELMRQAHARGIRVVIDYVMNHSSSQHPWFTASAQGDATFRDFYRWNASPGNTGGPLGTAWHRGSRGFYWGVFWGGMPDLNFETPAVRDSLFAASDFWLEDVGIDGFRLDAVKYLFEDGNTYEDLPQTHALWADFADHTRQATPDAYTVCEAWSSRDRVLPYVAPGSLSQCFAFDMAGAMLNAVRSGDARRLASEIQAAYGEYPHLSYATFLTNHDQDRVMSVLGGDQNRARSAASLLLTLPGTPYLYYGEEIGQTGVKPDEQIRRPMQWTGASGAGFTSGSPWIAVDGSYPSRNVADQSADEGSLLSHYRHLIQTRTASPALSRGDYLAVTGAPGSVMAFVRELDGEAVLVVSNLAADASGTMTLGLPPGVLAEGPHTLVDLLGGSTYTVTATGSSLSGLSIGGYQTRIFALSTVTSSDESPHTGSLQLHAPAPNPARGSARIAFEASTAGRVLIEAFDVLGRRVSVVADGTFSAGSHEVLLATDALAPGAYLVRLSQNGRQTTQQLVVIR